MIYSCKNVFLFFSFLASVFVSSMGTPHLAPWIRERLAMTPQIGGFPHFPFTRSTKIMGKKSEITICSHQREIFPGRNQLFAEIVLLNINAVDFGGQLITSIEFTNSFNLL